MTLMNWEDVIIGYWKGIIKYIMKDDMNQEGRNRVIHHFKM